MDEGYSVEEEIQDIEETLHAIDQINSGYIYWQDMKRALEQRLAELILLAQQVEDD